MDIIEEFNIKIDKIDKIENLEEKTESVKKIKEEFQDNIYDDAKEKRIFDYIYSLEYEEMPRYQYIIELLSD